jgi:hypothetical protein
MLPSPFKFHFTSVESLEEIHSSKLEPSKSTMASEGILVFGSIVTTFGLGSQISVSSGLVGSCGSSATSLVSTTFSASFLS